MTSSATSDVRIDVHLQSDGWDDALADDVRRGLTSTPKELPPKWFYDDRGSELFDQITRLAEYYPTEAEREILTGRAGEIARVSGADTLVELGSGTSDKTRALLEGMRRVGNLRRYVPFDVSEATLRDAAGELEDEFPAVEIHGVVGDFDHHLIEIPSGGRRLFAFLGGTIGNFGPAERAVFLADLVAVMAPGDGFLLGTDLVKDIDRLELAYDDPGGVTAAFNRNVLAVINRELEADFDLDAFTHVARFDRDNEWIEMLLCSQRPQRVRVAALDLEVSFAAGELMRTEISAKFRRAPLEAELAQAGLTMSHWWTDRAGDFAVSLSSPRR